MTNPLATVTAERDELAAQCDRLSVLLSRCHHYLCVVGTFGSDKQRLSAEIVAALARLEATEPINKN